MSKCCHCKEEKPERQFSPSVLKRSPGKRTCKKCNAESQRISYRKYRARDKMSQKELHAKNRKIAINLYGGKCACCGEKEYRFLTFDHINGGGNKERKNSKIDPPTWYASLAKEIRDDIQVLCFNCNCGRHWNHGICPHKEKSESP